MHSFTHSLITEAPWLVKSVYIIDHFAHGFPAMVSRYVSLQRSNFSGWPLGPFTSPPLVPRHTHTLRYIELFVGVITISPREIVKLDADGSDRFHGSARSFHVH
jgi:hypothetical protein